MKHSFVFIPFLFVPYLLVSAKRRASIGLVHSPEVHIFPKMLGAMILGFIAGNDEIFQGFALSIVEDAKDVSSVRATGSYAANKK